MTGLRIVAPFLPLPLEAPHHIELADFDWMDAFRMLSDSTQIACGVPTEAITDVSANLPVPALTYHTTHRRLMLWVLEVCACYLESDAFDRDTVMLDVDQLVYGNLARWFAPRIDLGILVRPTPKGAPGFAILNGVQFWSVRGKDRLATFYRQALAMACTLPEKDILWGADTIVLERLLEPLDRGLQRRAGLTARLIESDDVLHALNSSQVRHLEAGKMRPPARDVLCFRNLRKPYMRAVFDQTIAAVMG